MSAVNNAAAGAVVVVVVSWVKPALGWAVLSEGHFSAFAQVCWQLLLTAAIQGISVMPADTGHPSPPGLSVPLCHCATAAPGP